MKNLIFIFLLLCSCAEAQLQDIGIIIASKTHAYSEPNEQSNKIQILLEGETYPAKVHEPASESAYWYQITLANGKKAYVNYKQMAIVQKNAISPKITIDAVEYNLMTAKQEILGGYVNYNRLYTLYLYNPKIKKSYLIKAVADHYFLQNEEPLVNAANKNVLQYGDHSSDGYNSGVDVTVENNLLRLESGFSSNEANGPDDDRKEELPSIDYLEVKMTLDGQFWAYHIKPENKRISLKLNYLDYLLITEEKSELDDVNEIETIILTPKIQNAETKKMSNIYLEKSTKFDFLVEGSNYIQTESVIARGWLSYSSYFFEIHNNALLCYEHNTNTIEDDKHPSISLTIHWFDLEFKNGKIYGTLDKNRQRRLEFSEEE